MSHLDDNTLLNLVVAHASTAGIPSGRGGRKPSTKVGISVLRELTNEDLPLILEPPPVAKGIPVVQKLRSQHHHLARLLAQGLKPQEVSFATGYCPSRISTLQTDPAFMDLLAYYREQADEKFLDVHQRLAQVGTMALEELQGRLDEEPDKFTPRELMELTTMTFDRSVAPPKGGLGNRPGLPPGGGLPTLKIQFITPPSVPQSSLAPTLELVLGEGDSE